MLVDLAVGTTRPRIRLPVSIPEDRPVAAAVPAEVADSVTRPFRKVSPLVINGPCSSPAILTVWCTACTALGMHSSSSPAFGVPSVTFLPRWITIHDKLTGRKGATTCHTSFMLSAKAPRNSQHQSQETGVSWTDVQRGASHIFCTPFSGRNKPAVVLAISG